MRASIPYSSMRNAALTRSARLSFAASARQAGRGGVIRTRDPLLPKQMRYQAAPRPGRVKEIHIQHRPIKQGCRRAPSACFAGTSRTRGRKNAVLIPVGEAAGENVAPALPSYVEQLGLFIIGDAV